MSQKYADIIIDISHEAIDRTFQYKIPEELQRRIRIGMQVSIPFGRGNTQRTGYVVAFSDTPEFEENKIKEILEIRSSAVEIEGSLMELAAFIKERYGSTTIQALKTVIPIKEKVMPVKKNSGLGRGLDAIFLDNFIEEAAEQEQIKKIFAEI